jgi:peptide/nickel transport system permease protein
VLTLAAGPGVSMGGLLVLLIVTSWTSSARLVRGQMLRISRLPYIEAAVAAGIPTGRVWLRHAMPHAIAPLRVALPLSLAGLLGLESTLSFLGLGLPPDVPTWGRLLASVRVEPGAWWTAFFPGACLLLTIMSLTTLSKGAESRS